MSHLDGTVNNAYTGLSCNQRFGLGIGGGVITVPLHIGTNKTLLNMNW